MNKKTHKTIFKVNTGLISECKMNSLMLNPKDICYFKWLFRIIGKKLSKSRNKNHQQADFLKNLQNEITINSKIKA